MNCTFCDKVFSSKSSLNNHQKTAKYCLKLQDNAEISNFNCEYCNKIFTSKQNLNIHFVNCKDREVENVKKEKDKEIEFIKKEKDREIENIQKEKDKEIENITKEKDKEIENLRKEKDKLENQNIKLENQNGKLEIKKIKLEIEKDKLEKYKDNLEKELIKIKDENILLKGQLMILDKDHQTLTNLAQQPKNTTTHTNTNNILSIQTPLDFNNIDKIKNIIDEKYDNTYLFDGQKGVAKFAVEHILTDENGNLSYVCTDPSRQIFKYKDSSGDIKKDIEAKKFTNFLINGGIQNKSSNMFMKMWTDETGQVDGEKCSKLLDKASAIQELKDDNTIFKKELVYMTTKN